MPRNKIEVVGYGNVWLDMIHAARDTQELSNNARAVLFWLYTNHDDFKFTINQFDKKFRFGRDTGRKVRRELERKGYLAYRATRNSHGQFDTRIEFHPRPLPEDNRTSPTANGGMKNPEPPPENQSTDSPPPESPPPGKPAPGSPAPGNSGANNKKQSLEETTSKETREEEARSVPDQSVNWRVRYKEVQGSWNAFVAKMKAEGVQMSSVMKLNERRRKGIKKRFSQIWPQIEEVYANIEASKFLCGQAKDSFVVDFDFIWTKDYFQKIIEGGYGKDRKSKQIRREVSEMSRNGHDSQGTDTEALIERHRTGIPDDSVLRELRFRAEIEGDTQAQRYIQNVQV